MKIDLNARITEHFFWREALKLNELGIYVFPESQEVYDNIKHTCEKLELIREIINDRCTLPMEIGLQVTSFYRPEFYNRMIGGAKKSAHKYGLACDFRPTIISCKEVRKWLAEELDTLEIRMERQPKDLPAYKDWVHIDLRQPINDRYFAP